MTTLAENVADITGRLDDGQGAPVAPPEITTDDSPPCEMAAPKNDPFALLLAETDDEILADFRAVGIDLEAPHDLEAAQRQAAASRLLRFAAAARREASTLEQARDTEIALVEMHYAAQIGRATDRARACESAVETLAEIAREKGDFGKKKSASTPFGTFGFRETSESVELEDAAALTAYATQHAPEFVKASITLPLADARERFTDAELVERNALSVQWGEFKKAIALDEELPPGVKVKPESRTFFAKPDVEAVAGLEVWA